MKRTWIIIAVAVLAGVVVCVSAMVALNRAIDSVNATAKREAQEEEERAFNGECHDEATLIATSAGSPDKARCLNRRHKMRIEVSTKAGEEVGAVVHCECVP